MSPWIDSPQTLSEHLARWAGQPLVALDTEFIRERTFYPQLALVQLAVPGEILLVDPLVPGMDAALRPLLVDPAVTKIMHSASEDLQALQRGCGALPGRCSTPRSPPRWPDSAPDWVTRSWSNRSPACSWPRAKPARTGCAAR